MGLSSSKGFNSTFYLYICGIGWYSENMIPFYSKHMELLNVSLSH